MSGPKPSVPRGEPKRKRFTLIELLVVIAIIGILAALLLPALSRAKIAAIKAVCLGQLKQFVVAAHNYADDYEGHFPSRLKRGGYPHQIKRTSNYAYDLNAIYIKPYIDQGNAIMYCPSRPVSAANLAAPNVTWSSYTFFIWGDGAYYWQVPQPELQLRPKVIIPEKAPIWACKIQVRYGVPGPNHTRSGNIEGQNAAMLDGSARWYQNQETELLWKYGGGAGDQYFWPIYREE